MDTIGTIKTTPPSVSSACRWFLPCMQDVGSGVPLDRSGNSRNAAIGSATTDAAVWANAGFATTTTSTNTDKALSQAAGRLAWDGSQGQSLLLAAQIKMAAPAAEAWTIGDRASGNGLVLSINTSGQPQLLLRDGITSYTSGFSTNVVIADGSLHSVVLYIDGVLKTATLWVDGVIGATLNAANVAGSLAGSTVSSLPFGYGHGGNPTSGGSIAAQLRNLHAYVKSGSITGAAALAARLLRDPFKPLSVAEL